jgi:hypothetical protein
MISKKGSHGKSPIPKREKAPDLGRFLGHSLRPFAWRVWRWQNDLLEEVMEPLKRET